VNVAEATVAKEADIQLFSLKGSSRGTRLARNAYENGHKVGCDEARILETESKRRYSKYGIGPCGILNQFDQPTQSGHFSHLDPPYQQLTDNISTM
jgi:hypothetical protein